MTYTAQLGIMWPSQTHRNKNSVADLLAFHPFPPAKKKKKEPPLKMLWFHNWELRRQQVKQAAYA